MRQHFEVVHYLLFLINHDCTITEPESHIYIYIFEAIIEPISNVIQ